MKKMMAIVLALLEQVVIANPWHNHNIGEECNCTNDGDVVVTVVTNIGPGFVKGPDIDQLISAYIRRKSLTPKGRSEIHGKIVHNTVDAVSKTVEQVYEDGTVYIVPMEIKTNTVNVAARRVARERNKQALQARKDSLKSKRQREAEAMMRKLKEQTLTIEKNGNTGKETVK